MNVTDFFGQHPSIPMDRRNMLKRAAAGFGYLAFAGLCAEAAGPPSAMRGPLSPKTPHHRPRARRVIFLFMHGGPSQTDTFDYKPRLNRENGNPCPFKRPGVLADGKRNRKPPPLLGSPSPTSDPPSGRTIQHPDSPRASSESRSPCPTTTRSPIAGWPRVRDMISQVPPGRSRRKRPSHRPPVDSR